MSTSHEVTRQLYSALQKHWKCEEPAIMKQSLELLEALDTDLIAGEYGQSDEVQDKMALLDAAITEYDERKELEVEEEEDKGKHPETLEEELEDDEEELNEEDDDDNDDDEEEVKLG